MKSLTFKRLSCASLVLVLLLSLLPLPARAAQAPDIYADSAIVIDYDTGEALYDKSADALMVPASMTKIMTAYIIFEELEAGRFTLDTLVPISRENARISRNSSYPMSVPLPSGGEVSVDTLLRLILVPSASASCIVMAEYIEGTEAAFVERMNSTARELGMTAQFENCHGAFPHYTTARSIAILVREFIQRFPQVLEYTALTEVEFNGRTYENTNKLLTDYYYEGCDGFKTGTITAAGYCLAGTAVRNGHRVISVVMKSDSDRHRHTDSSAILDYAFDWLADNSYYFDDIAHHWARLDIEELSRTGVALHTRGGDFRPDAPITRAEFTAMLVSALGPRGALDGFVPGPAPSFQDLEDCWARAEIERAASLGLVTGSYGQFRPDAPISREEAMVILDAALSLPDGAAASYPDSASISSWAVQAVENATAAGLFSGDSSGNLNPGGQFTRGEAAAVFCAVLERL